MSILSKFINLFRRSNPMTAVDNSLIKSAEAALADATAKVKDALAAGAANADVVASLNEQITAKDEQIKQLTDELAASQAESTDLGNKLTADAASLAALVPPAA